jgi:hypothetical protein
MHKLRSQNFINNCSREARQQAFTLARGYLLTTAGDLCHSEPTLAEQTALREVDDLVAAIHSENPVGNASWKREVLTELNQRLDHFTSDLLNHFIDRSVELGFPDSLLAIQAAHKDGTSADFPLQYQIIRLWIFVCSNYLKTPKFYTHALLTAQLALLPIVDEASRSLVT